MERNRILFLICALFNVAKNDYNIQQTEQKGKVADILKYTSYDIHETTR